MVFGQQPIDAKRTEALALCLQMFLRTTLPCFIWGINMCMRTSLLSPQECLFLSRK